MPAARETAWRRQNCDATLTQPKTCARILTSRRGSSSRRMISGKAGVFELAHLLAVGVDVSHGSGVPRRRVNSRLRGVPGIGNVAQRGFDGGPHLLLIGRELEAMLDIGDLGFIEHAAGRCGGPAAGSARPRGARRRRLGGLGLVRRGPIDLGLVACWRGCRRSRGRLRRRRNLGFGRRGRQGIERAGVEQLQRFGGRGWRNRIGDRRSRGGIGREALGDDLDGAAAQPIAMNGRAGPRVTPPMPAQPGIPKQATPKVPVSSVPRVP